MLCREVTFLLKGMYLFKDIYFMKQTQKGTAMQDSVYVKWNKTILSYLCFTINSNPVWLHSRSLKIHLFHIRCNSRRISWHFQHCCWLFFLLLLTFLSSYNYEVSPCSQILLSCSLMFLPCSSSDCQDYQAKCAIPIILNFSFRSFHRLSRDMNTK